MNGLRASTICRLRGRGAEGRSGSDSSGENLGPRGVVGFLSALKFLRDDAPENQKPVSNVRSIQSVTLKRLVSP